MIVDIFAGPGGWDTGLGMLGRRDVLGIDHDRDACMTARTAGHRREQIDVAEVTAGELARMAPDVEGLIGSPPCPPWSPAGLHGGTDDEGRILDHLARVEASGEWIDYRDRSTTVFDLFGEPAVDLSVWTDPRSPLVLEPARWALALRPRWIACEQVPDALPIWRALATFLDGLGYSTACGVLAAEQYGVPQTRRRAVLVASLDREATLPEPTHAAWTPGGVEVVDGLLPPVSMGQALGWPDGLVGFPRRDDRGSDGYRDRDFRRVSDPAFTLTEKARSWSRWTMLSAGTTNTAGQRPRGLDEPSATITGKGTGSWVADGAPSVRVSIQEAARLQSFPADYPWRGTSTAQYRQIGDAVPPLLAVAVLGNLLGNDEWRGICRATFAEPVTCEAGA